jgi:hypothetical protein
VGPDEVIAGQPNPPGTPPLYRQVGVTGSPLSRPRAPRGQ